MSQVSLASFAKRKLGGEVSLVWERIFGAQSYSRWERAGIVPEESCVVSMDPASGPYAVTDDVGALQRFLFAANHRFSDAKSAISILKDVLPYSKRVLIDDPDGFMRQFIDGDWKSPFMENGVLTFYCNDSDRGIVERWRIDGCQLEVEDFANGECFTIL